MLIILFITTAILVVTGLQPFIIYSTLFGICYLPGLVIFALFKKGSLKFNDLILSFPVSIGIASLLLLCLLYAGVHVKFIVHIILGIIGFSVLVYIVKYGKLPSLTIKLTNNEIRFIIVAFLMTLLFSIPVISERIVISAHGFHHSTIATQIMNGIFPPENPGMGGTPLSYHWGYHSFVAAISLPADLPPLRVISILNVMSLFFIFCIAYRSADYLGFADGYRYIVPLALIGLMRSDSIFFIANKLFSWNAVSLRQITFPEVRPSEILQSWVWGGGAPWFDRRLFFINKFYNANTMPLGIALCLSYFLFLLTGIKNTHEYKNSIICKVIFGLLIIASCVIYPPLAIIPLLHTPVWAGIAILSKRTDLKKGFKKALNILLPYGIAVLIVLPYFLSVSSNTGEPVIRISFHEQSMKNLLAFWLPMPLIFIGVVFSFRKLPSEIFIFLIVAASLCFSLSTFTQVTFGNSAKFTFILSFFYAIFFLSAMSGLLHFISRRWVRRVLSSCIILFLLITPVITEAAYIVSPLFSDYTYSFSGRHIVFAQDKKRNEAYVWIRSNTAPESLLMLTYIETSNPDTIAQNSTYEPAAIAERNLFIIKDWYTVTSPEYMKRIMVREKLFSDSSDPEIKKYLFELNRPLYLIVENMLSPFIIKEAIFNNFDFDSEIFELLFTNGRQNVYRIKTE